MMGPADLDHYLEHGYAVIPGVIDEATLSEARAAVERVCPPPASGVDSSFWLKFPYEEPSFNRVTAHPALREIAKAIIGGDVICDQANLWAKYAGVPEDADQDLHVDLYLHTLTYPSRQRRFWQVLMFVYLTDVTLESSPTYVVPWEHTEEEFLVPNVWERPEHPQLYAHERPAVAPAGSVFVYGTRTFHRGSRFIDRDGRRVLILVSFKPTGCEWAGTCNWPGLWWDNAPAFQETLAQTDIAGLTSFGFPAPGHPFWDDETLRGVAARYPGLDLSAYVEAVSA
jgi:hypothetical protein